MERIEIVENGLFLVFEIADDKCFKFLHFGKKPFNEKDIIARSTWKQIYCNGTWLAYAL